MARSEMSKKKKILQLIQLVKSHPALYSRKLQRVVHLKQQLWTDIALELKETESAVRTRWKSIRDGYLKYLKCINKPNTNVIYKKYKWSKELKFLKKHLKYEYSDQTPSNHDETSKTSTYSDASSPGPGETPPQKETFQGMIHDDASDVSYILPDDQTSENSIITVPDDDVDSRPGSPEVTVESSKPLKCNNTVPLSTTELFMLKFANDIDRLSDKRRVEVKWKIAEIVMDAEMEELNERKKKVYGN